MEPRGNGKTSAMRSRRAAAGDPVVAGRARRWLQTIFTNFGATMTFPGSRPVPSVYGVSERHGRLPAGRPGNPVLTMFGCGSGALDGLSDPQIATFNREGRPLCFNAPLKTNKWAACAGPLLSRDRWPGTQLP